MVGRLFIALGAALVLAGCGEPAVPPAGKTEQRPLTLFAASSTIDVMTTIAADFEKKTGIPVRCSFDASSTLAKQIERGAPADVYLSANLEWVQYLHKQEVAQPTGMQKVMLNQLVWVARTGSDVPPTMPGPGFKGRLAIADPDHVPAGKYAKDSLVQQGLWEGVKDRIIPAADVRTALRYVMLGEADAGIVYATDARSTKEVEVRKPMPTSPNTTIAYYATLVRGAAPEAKQFMAYLESKEVTGVLKAAGFDTSQRKNP